jgi:hypothetical protein
VEIAFYLWTERLMAGKSSLFKSAHTDSGGFEDEHSFLVALCAPVQMGRLLLIFLGSRIDFANRVLSARGRSSLVAEE